MRVIVTHLTESLNGTVILSVDVVYDTGLERRVANANFVRVDTWCWTEADAYKVALAVLAMRRLERQP